MSAGRSCTCHCCSSARTVAGTPCLTALLSALSCHICRQELRTRLLSLFADFGSLAQQGGRHQDLGALLPVIAASSEGLQPMGGAAQSNHSMSFDHLTSLRDEDTNTLKVCPLHTYVSRRIVGYSWGPHDCFIHVSPMVHW